MDAVIFFVVKTGLLIIGILNFGNLVFEFQSFGILFIQDFNLRDYVVKYRDIRDLIGTHSHIYIHAYIHIDIHTDKHTYIYFTVGLLSNSYL